MDLVPVLKDLVRYVQTGVSAFLLKDATHSDFLKTIRAVAEGEDVLPPKLTGSLFSRILEHATSKAKGNPFTSIRITSRVRNVIGLPAGALSNKEIACRLHLVIDTAKSHVCNILEKFARHTHL